MKILVTRHVDEKALRSLAAHDVVVWPETSAMPESEFRDQAESADALMTSLTEPVDEQLLAATHLSAVSQVAVGVDNIDLDRCTEIGIPVGHTPDVLTETTADTAWALLAAAVRRVPEGRDHVLAGDWTEWRPDLLLGGDLHGATLGIVGLGRIGAAVARRAAGFDMRILYTGPRRKPHLESSLRASYRSLEELLAESHFVVVAAPLTESTRRLLDAERLALMAPDSVLVNISRGPVVDTEALEHALRQGRPGSAALDVTDPEPLPADHPLLELPNCLVIPHLGSASVRTRERMVQRAVTNLERALAGERMPWCANPEVYSRPA